MKQILNKKYDSPWRISYLDYRKELRPGVSDVAYVLIRNMVGSINSYEIVDLEVDEAEQTISCKCQFWVYKRWANEILELVDFLHDSYEKMPNILMANEETFKLIDAQSYTHKVEGLVGENFKLKFCIDQKLGKNEYRIIYDEQAVF